MNLKWSYVIFGLLVCVNALSEGHIQASIDWTGLEYEDACQKAAKSKWAFIRHPNNATLELWEDALKEYGLLKRQEEEKIVASNNETDFSELPQLEYKYKLISKPGDALLPSEDWDEYVSFVGDVEYLKLTGNYSKDGNKLFRQDAENSLARIGTAEDKLKAWTLWHETLKPLTTKFSKNLQLIRKAAEANDITDVRVYWEMLSEYENGYKEAQDKWNEIAALHQRFLKFIQTRLARKYGNSMTNDSLPAHLLGTIQGYDWTNLAIDVIPDANIVFEIRKNLWKKGFVGKKLYKYAARLGNVTLKHLPEALFFEESEFTAQCPPRLINLCSEGRMQLSTCSESSIANYLSAHKNIAKIIIHQMSEESKPILNVANRYSAFEEGVAELLGILASSRAWLVSLNLVNETDDLDQTRLASVMITALDVLPRMAYYLSADMWRIDAINNNSFDARELTNSWWKYRSQYEGISTNSVELPTFLDDDYIVSNRPYLSKFIGTILGFQIYEYLMGSTEVKTEKIIASTHNYESKSQLIKMIQHGTAENWYESMRQHLEFYDVSPDALLSYFTPLTEYLDDHETEEVTAVSIELEKNLETIENQYKKDFNTPTTTTTTTTTTTMQTPTTRKIPMKGQKVTKAANPPITESTKSQKIIEDSMKHDAEIQADATKATEQISSDENEDEKKVTKSTTKKAVYAVGAALFATIIIVIISIFGRRRCRKTPKNRRYV